MLLYRCFRWCSWVQLKELVRSGVSPAVLKVALHSVENVVDVVSLLLSQNLDI